MTRSRHTPAAITGHWIRPTTRWAVYHRDDFACVYCEHIGALSLDHVHAVRDVGRDNSPSNLVTACLSCNSSKKHSSARAWFAVLRAQGIDVLAVRRRIAKALKKPIDRERGRFLAEIAGRITGATAASSASSGTRGQRRSL